MSIKVGNIMSILLVVMCITGLSAAAPTTLGPFGTPVKNADFTEGGHLETDFDVNFMAEWWYINGDARLVASDGEKQDIGFFVVMAHQESPIFIQDEIQLSHLLTFYGLFFDDGTTIFNCTETYVPQIYADNYIALHTPYVDYMYPDGLKGFYGSALPGYNLNYISDDIVMDLFFQTNIDKTIDQADQPLNFNTYGNSYGTLHGSIILDGKRYTVTQAEGYMDHMIPVSNSGGTWAMDMHGWSWFEVTTKNYQAVAYAVRGLDDGYDDYSYKHLTLLNKHNGKVLAEYSGDDITITESDWIIEGDYNRKRPSVTVFSASDLIVTLNAENVVYFNQSKPDNIGFVDFMAFQPNGATIQYKGNIEEGSAFSEYLVSDIGALLVPPTI
ncbi:MAG: hypothetical protein GQ469_09565 [Methanosarcinales archaeon]|nr:hypothetical protein [Methanosarcinales archaeon]